MIVRFLSAVLCLSLVLFQSCDWLEEEDCMCIEIYAPVCGDDGVAYDNSCFAECAGVSYTDGACTTEVDSRCNMEPNPGECCAAIPRYYFDKEEGKCKEFIWGGCGEYPFETLEECQECGCE